MVGETHARCVTKALFFQVTRNEGERKMRLKGKREKKKDKAKSMFGLLPWPLWCLS
jgi:hypothetical protein